MEKYESIWRIMQLMAMRKEDCRLYQVDKDPGVCYAMRSFFRRILPWFQCLLQQAPLQGIQKAWQIAEFHLYSSSQHPTNRIQTFNAEWRFPKKTKFWNITNWTTMWTEIILLATDCDLVQVKRTVISFIMKPTLQFDSRKVEGNYVDPRHRKIIPCPNLVCPN